MENERSISRKSACWRDVGNQLKKQNSGENYAFQKNDFKSKIET